MIILGIDYGRRKFGLALASGGLAQPHSVLRASSWQDAFEKIGLIVKKEGVEKIVVGVSEAEMREEQEAFARDLERTLGTAVEVWDETLTTKEAQLLSREVGLPLKKRRKLEDAYAASLMLQSYLEAHGKKKSS